MFVGLGGVGGVEGREVEAGGKGSAGFDDGVLAVMEDEESSTTGIMARALGGSAWPSREAARGDDRTIVFRDVGGSVRLHLAHHLFVGLPVGTFDIGDGLLIRLHCLCGGVVLCGSEGREGKDGRKQQAGAHGVSPNHETEIWLSELREWMSAEVS
jgi:hypothetical protein